jgi:TonB family protein
MTLTVKNSTELNGPGKPGAPSQNSENKAGQSPRSNPVCLEVSITIRSLPAEAGGMTQPIREDGRTVIVFDNGAVLRSTTNLTIGQTLILSSPNGREVVCRVVGGRNLPSVKGYVEVEFIEPAFNFWGIHQDVNSVSAVAPPATQIAPREAAVPPPPAPPVTPRAAAPLEAAAKPASVSLGSGPTFEDIPGLVTRPTSAVTRESKGQPVRPGAGKMTKDTSDYNLSEIASSTSVANWSSPASNLPAEKHAIPTASGSSSIRSASPAPSRDFLSKGLMAYEQPRSSSSASNGRMPLIVGVAAIVLAGVGAVVFFLHRSTAPVSVAKTAVVSQPSTPEPPAAISAPEPVQGPQGEAAQVATQNQTQAQPVAVDQAQTAAAVIPVPAVVTSPAIADSRADSRNVRRQEKTSVVTRQPELSSSPRPVIPNLKMGSPKVPKQKFGNPGQGTAPVTEIASTEALGGSAPAGLLTSAGRTSHPPAPPPSAAAPSAPAPSTPAPFAPAPVSAAKTVRDPKMISSTRPVYPATAKQTNIQGIVTVSASIDENGKVVSAKALSGPLLLREAAVDSVKQWKYSPSLLDGKPASSQVTVNIEFRLN